MSTNKWEIKAYISQLGPTDYQTIIHDGLQYIDLSNLIASNSKIFLKPNLTYPTFKPGVMTSVEAVEAAVHVLRQYTPHIFIGDADSGGYNPFSMNEVYRETGLWEFSKNNGIEIVNLSEGDRRPIHFTINRKEFFLDLPKLLLDEIDLFITMPVPKIHANTGVSLSFKNQWGCIPEPNDRLRLHPYFKQVVLEVNKAVKSKVAIIDGKYGLNFNGPMNGTPVELNWVMVSNDIGASVRLACELMQIRLNTIEHLRYAENMGAIPKLSEININQEFSAFIKEEFYLSRKITDLPGFLAFHNPFIAYLGYFSPFSKLLHRILYLFREPLYDYEKYSKGH